MAFDVLKCICNIKETDLTPTIYESTPSISIIKIKLATKLKFFPLFSSSQYHHCRCRCCYSAVPSAPPDNVQTGMLNLTAGWVKWQPPPPQHHNGILLGYKIQVNWNEIQFCDSQHVQHCSQLWNERNVTPIFYEATFHSNGFTAPSRLAAIFFKSCKEEKESSKVFRLDRYLQLCFG